MDDSFTTMQCIVALYAQAKNNIFDNSFCDFPTTQKKPEKDKNYFKGL